LAERLNPLGWKDRYYAVRDETDDLVVFFGFAAHHDGVKFGLGLRPDLTGKGWGEACAKAGLEFAGNFFTPRRFLVQVAKFNRRAIRVYEKMGFKVEKFSATGPTE
jgi:ribosomal-protein-alanine N-acetyltransferase